MAEYDYLIVGAGLYGAVFAHEARQAGRRCLVVEKRSQTGGNIYCENREGINIHKYGAHIFHTSNEMAWKYVNRFARFNNYVNSPIANYKGEIYNLPFNMNTFSKLWGISTPAEAIEIIDRQRQEIKGEPKNLEQQAISQVGRDVYEKLIKGYTEKQWGRECKDLPAFIIRRLPVRFIYDNNYFNDRFQGVPEGGYNTLIDRLLMGCPVRLNIDFNAHKEELLRLAERVIYTGPIDAYYDFKFGELQYRSLRFETVRYAEPNHQGVAVVNYTDRETPYTRSIEHKHFEFGRQSVTYVTYEYPGEWHKGDEPYYPVNDERNGSLYSMYRDLAEGDPRMVFCGRLGAYVYYDMDKTIISALELAHRELTR